MSCNHTSTRCIQSRMQEHHSALRRDFKYTRYRKHLCLDCGHKWNTLEFDEEQMQAAARTIIAVGLKNKLENLPTIIMMEILK